MEESSSRIERTTKTMKLRINEIFGPTIQGEGNTMGKEVFFLRLSMCNLQCVWCDTPYTWNWIGTGFKHPDKHDRNAEEKIISEEEVLQRLNQLLNGSQNRQKALVISGGEPLIQQKALLDLIVTLKQKGWWVEVETNGTIVPDEEMFFWVDQFNVSPKLSNSENSLKKRVRDLALKSFASSGKSFFKFVMSSSEDIGEIETYVNDFNLDKSRIFLMPLGKTNEELEQTRAFTKGLAENLGIRFSDRLHVTMFGGKRGV